MSLFFQKNRASDQIALDLNGNMARFVYGRSSAQGAEILRLARKSLKEDESDEWREFVNDCFKKWHLKEKRAVVVLSSNLFITKSVDIPSKDREEIRKIIDLQAGRFTPYSRDEIVIDYSCMETPEQHYTNVLLVIVKRKIIERCYEILDRSGVDIEAVVAASEGMGKVYGELAEASGGRTASGLHIAQSCSDLTVVNRHQMVFARNIPVGLEQFRSDRESAERAFIEELNKSFAAFKDQGTGQPPKALFLAGLIRELDFLEQAIQGSVPYVALNGVAVRRIEPSSLFQLALDAKGTLESEADVSFFDLMASLKSASSFTINLVPKEIKMKRKVRQGGREAIGLGILILTAFLMLSIFLVTKIYLKKELIKRLDKLNEASFERSRILEKMSTKTRALRDLLGSRGKGLYVFEKINSLIGDDIYLTSLSYDKEGNVKFTGTAISMSRVFAFVTELEESNYFKDVKASETKSRREGQKEVADFQIECVIAEGV